MRTRFLPITNNSMNSVIVPFSFMSSTISVSLQYNYKHVIFSRISTKALDNSHQLQKMMHRQM